MHPRCSSPWFFTRRCRFGVKCSFRFFKRPLQFGSLPEDANNFILEVELDIDIERCINEPIMVKWSL